MKPRFRLFSTLPAELRNQIWREALPESAISPSLVPFKLGYWRIEPPADHPEQIYRCELMNVPVAIPLAYVNREARSIALAWAREQGLKARPIRDRFPVFVRPFEYTVDAIYFNRDQIRDLEDEMVEAIEEILEPQYEGLSFGTNNAVRRFAMTESVAHDFLALEGLHEVLDYFMNVKELLVVVGKPLELRSLYDPNQDARTLCHCGFVSAPGDEFTFIRDKSRFEANDGMGEIFGDGVVSGLVHRLNLNEQAFEHGFKVRPITALRRPI